MSDTPRTDAGYLRKMLVCSGLGWPSGEELSNAIGILDALISELAEKDAALKRAEAERDSFREDAERYRWLRAHADSMSLDPPLTVARVCGWGLDAWSGDNIDGAIDAAMKAGQ